MASRFVRNTAFGLLAGLCYSASGLVSSIVMARLLGVEGTGVATYLIWMVTIAVALTDVGVVASLMRFLPELKSGPRPEAADDLAQWLFRVLMLALLLPMVLMLGAFAVAVGAPTSGLGQIVSGDPIRWLLVALATLVQATAGFVMGYLRGLQEFQRVAFITATSAFVQIAGLLIGGLLYGINGAFVGFVSSSIIPAAMALRFVFRYKPIDPTLKARIIRHGAYSWAAALSALFVWSRVEIVFLAHYFGPGAVGLFAVGLTLASLATQGPILLTSAMLPYFSERAGVGDIERSRVMLSSGSTLIAFLVLPIGFGSAAIVPALIPIVFGEAFAQAAPMASILIASASLAAVGAVASNLVYAMERSDFVFGCNLLGVVLSGLVGFIVIPAFGPIGAAYGRGAVQLVMLGVGLTFVHRNLTCPVPVGRLVRLVVSALSCALAAHFVLGFCGGGLVGLIPAIATGAVVYAIAVRLTRALDPDDMTRLRAIVGGLPRPIQGLVGVVMSGLSPTS